MGSPPPPPPPKTARDFRSHVEQVEKVAGLFDEAGGQGITTWVGGNKGRTDQVPNLERAGVNTQTRPGPEGELGEGRGWAP